MSNLGCVCNRGLGSGIFGGCLSVMLLGLMLCVAADSQAAVTTYPDSWGAGGFTLVREDLTGVEINFSVNQWILSEREINGQNLQVVHLPGTYLPNDEGAPDLPGNACYIAIPQGATAEIHIIDSRTESLFNVDMAPAPRIPREDEDGPLVYRKDASIYSQNAFYPDNPIRLSTPMKVRGVDVVLLGITPFQYNPITQELIVHRDVRVDVSFTGGNGHIGEDRLRSRWWDPMLKNMLLNSATLPEVEYRTISDSRTEDFEYIIITPDNPDFIAWADSIQLWRTEQGIRAGVVTLSDIGGNTTTLIENYINNAYDTWDIPPVAVLLMADYGTTGNSSIVSPIWNSYCASDNIYADRDGDNMPDMAFARITAQNTTHLANTVGKLLDYEREPPMDSRFYSNPIIAGGWQDDRWFILCCEVLFGYMEQVLGKSPIREYAVVSGNNPGVLWSEGPNTSIVVDYFGPNGLGYIPATPEHLNDWGGNATRINADINNGAFILQHRDHGGTDGWGEPDYTTPDLAGLFNEMPVFVFSINCLTGMFDMSGECFAEAFHRYPMRALGIIAATEVSYSFVNDAYVWGMYDYMWPDFDPGYGVPGPHVMRPAFANVYGKYYLQVSNWPYNDGDKTVTYHLFHHHGDAFMNVYSEVPRPLSVTHDPVLLTGVDFFTVTADAGSFIGLTVNGEIIGVGEGTGAPLPITIPPQLPDNTMLVTITKQNFFRYVQSVPIIPPEGPYVVYDAYSAAEVVGIDNGQVDAGEELLLTVQVENVGVEDALGTTVTVTTDDPYITMTDDTELYGDIPAGEVASVADGFAFTVSSDAPDNHGVVFAVHVEEGTTREAWDSNFALVLHAPVVEFTLLAIDDGTGDNHLDPGETGTLTLTVTNHGSCAAMNLTVTMMSDNGYLDVTNGSGMIASLAPSASGSPTPAYTVAVDLGCPDLELAYLYFDLTGDLGYETNFIRELTLNSFHESVESGQGDWTHEAGPPDWLDQWHISTEDAWSPTHAWKCGDTGTGDYGNHVDARLVMPVVNLPVGAQLRFMHRINAETSGTYPDSAYDGGIVEVFDGGDWVQLPSAQYNKHFRHQAGGGAPATHPFPGGIPCFSGAIAWSQAAVDLSAYSGDVQIRFRFGSDNGGTAEGWYVDDIEIVRTSSLAAPTNLQANLVGTVVNLSWNSPGGPTLDLLGYNLYRDFEEIQSMITGLSATDDLWGMPFGTYTYHVKAIYTGGESGYSDPAVVDYQAGPHPVTDVTAVVSGTDIALFWTASSGAESYQVYRVAEPFVVPQPGDLIGTTADTNYTDEGILLTEAMAFYVVIAVNSE